MFKLRHGHFGPSHKSLPFLFLFLLVFIGGTGTYGCNSCSKSGPPPCSGTSGLTMILNIGNSGNQVVYTGSSPGAGLPSTCVNRVTQIQNPAATTLKIANDKSDCNAGTPIVLAGFNASTTKAQMMQLFGTTAQPLPIAVSACGDFGGNPPQTLALSLTVVSSTN